MNRFNEDDIGKRVLLILDPQKLDNLETEDDYEKIPYEAIKDFKFVSYIKVTSKPAPRIVDIGPKAPKVDISSIVKRLGENEIRTRGDIVEITEDYLKIEVVKDKRAPWHQDPSIYSK